MGAVERVNRSFFNKHKKISGFGDSSWEEYVPKETFATNISFNNSIRTSPYIMKYGFEPQFTMDKQFKIPIKQKSKRACIEERNKCFTEYARELS
jgi:hypothetical protein